MKNLIPAICVLWLSLVPVLCFSQENDWVIGEWKGGYFGEKSKITKKFESRLQIVKVYGNMFEGVVQCILPSDTTIRLHTRISGRIYPGYLMTKLKEVVYFKDPPGQYTWAKHCFTCDSMKLTLVKRGDSVVMNGERRCDSLCNIIARYSRKSSDIAKKTPAIKDASKETASLEFSADYTPMTKDGKAVAGVTPPVTTTTNNAGQGSTTQKTAVAKPGTGNTAARTPANHSSGQPDNDPKTGAARGSLEFSAGASQPPKGTSAAATAVANTTGTQSTNTNFAQQTSAQLPAGGNTAGGPLGHQTPGIDRDNVFDPSMPARAAGKAPYVFARPIHKDSVANREVLAGRSVVKAGRFEVTVDSAEVIFMDNGIVDGDTVSLYYNGQMVVQKIPLNLKAFVIKVPIYKGGANILAVSAVSLGSLPPNTAYVRLICGERETSFLLSSTLSKSSSIEIYRAESKTD